MYLFETYIRKHYIKLSNLCFILFITEFVNEMLETDFYTQNHTTNKRKI